MNDSSADEVPGHPNGMRHGRRRPLVESVLDELTGWQSQMRMGAFKRWHQGALSLIHLGVLSALETDGPLSMSRVAETLDVSIASATGIVDRMESRGVVRRRHGEADRRIVLVEATEAGAQVTRDMVVQRRELLAMMLDQLTDDELTGFLTGLGALRAARSRLTVAAARPATHRPGDHPQPEATHR